MRHLPLLCALLASTPALAAPPAPATQQAAVLERVVLVARHGIRSPTKPPQTLQSQTGHVWAQWPVAPGELTDHGKQALEQMVGMVRQHYVQAGLLPASGCPTPGSLTIWADAKDHRTRESGAIWAEHLAPSCKQQSLSLAAAQEDPIFAGPATPLSVQEQNAITREFNQRVSTTPPTVGRSMNTLQAVLAPAACTTDKPHCLSTNTTTLAWKKDKPHLEGGLATGGTAAENLLLEYTQGMPVHAEPFSQQNPATLIEQVFPLHTQESWLIRRLPTLAAHKGATMASVVQDVLAGKPATALPAATEQTKLLVLSGHDTNLDVLATLYGLDWSFTDQPDPTAPNTTLAFELWRSPSGPYVTVRLFHQGLEALRTLATPDPAVDMQVIASGPSLQALRPIATQ
ncbi:phosphoanhydride phosphorylase [Acetobacter syzygii]|uniref:histidine-type phosphatase n=1 Tax=Acetobacter syzygii TaxID=146476 RepID=UPI0005E00720|nr:histidine-type phosphatase [Acetobacter syzygii]GAN71720.1 phosphoanhydride phosphohydrolase [Acetobacter syzygii]GBR62219.1 periplasmic phosphoanhydride phosphohydrolase [Acetobacter syzygii NRIC 0483]GEL56863.1 phosphoanhydride phosphorylase [Acetobacter syzygii]